MSTAGEGDTVFIREFGPDDSLEELTRLINDAYAVAGKEGFSLAGIRQTAAMTAERIAPATCFVAVLDGALVGTVSMRAGFQTELCPYLGRPGLAYGYQFAVAPGIQAHGIGSMLRRQCREWARAGGFTEIAVDTDEDYERTIRPMQALGYRVVGRVVWPGDSFTSVVLARDLPPD